MEKKYIITLNHEQLANLLTALHMEISRDEYSDEIKEMLLDTFNAVMEFKAKRF